MCVTLKNDSRALFKKNFVIPTQLDFTDIFSIIYLITYFWKNSKIFWPNVNTFFFLQGKANWPPTLSASTLALLAPCWESWANWPMQTASSITGAWSFPLGNFHCNYSGISPRSGSWLCGRELNLVGGQAHLFGWAHVGKSPPVVFSVTQEYLTLWNPTDCSRLSCPSLSPGVCSNSRPLSGWCYLTIPSSASHFSFCFHWFSFKFNPSLVWPQGHRHCQGDFYYVYLGVYCRLCM